MPIRRGRFGLSGRGAHCHAPDGGFLVESFNYFCWQFAARPIGRSECLRPLGAGGRCPPAGSAPYRSLRPLFRVAIAPLPPFCGRAIARPVRESGRGIRPRFYRLARQFANTICNRGFFDFRGMLRCSSPNTPENRQLSPDCKWHSSRYRGNRQMRPSLLPDGQVLKHGRSLAPLFI